jgi:hypothetical protein
MSLEYFDELAFRLDRLWSGAGVEIAIFCGEWIDSSVPVWNLYGWVRPEECVNESMEVSIVGEEYRQYAFLSTRFQCNAEQ